MADNEVWDLLMGDTGDAQEATRKMAQMLRYKQGMASMGADAGGPVNAAKMDADLAREDGKNLFGGLEKRMQYGAERQKVLSQQAQDKMANDLLRQQMKDSADLEAARIRAAQAQAQAANKDKQALDKLGQAEYNKLIREWDPAQQVRSAFGQAGQTDLNAIRGLALAVRNGSLAKFDPTNVQQAELAGVLGRIVTGGVPTAHTLEQFNPGSLKKMGAVLQQWVSGKPVPVGMMEWAESMLKMLQGESEAAQNFIRKSRLSNTERLKRYSQINPESARRFVQNMGMDKQHPQGYIDLETFDPVGFDPNATAATIAGATGGGGGVQDFVIDPKTGTLVPMRK